MRKNVVPVGKRGRPVGFKLWRHGKLSELRPIDELERYVLKGGGRRRGRILPSGDDLFLQKRRREPAPEPSEWRRYLTAVDVNDGRTTPRERLAEYFMAQEVKS